MIIRSCSTLTSFSYKSAHRLITQFSKRFIIQPILCESQTVSLHFNRSTNRYTSSMTQTTFVKHALEDNEIIKSAQDKREYRALELTNGMKVMLISDPETDKSSAALDVNVGHMCDPSDLPGLAHFCEHMLFLGTEKYPVENEYNKFLSEQGGSANAFTSAEHTNFYFEVVPDHLPGALDRFAQFFLSPLFTESATEREVNAVHSENDKNLQSDPWRLHQLEKSTADPKHDYSKFGTGNKFTLETRPKELGLDVREELLKFHSKYYSSNIMALAVLGKESLNTLSELVLPLFSGVTNKQLTIPEWLEHPYGPEQLKIQAHIVPVKDIRSLNILWPTPDLHPYYASSPGHYLGHMIGHEGPGSLLSELKARGWVNALVGGQKSGAKGFMFFMVNVDLTEDGIEHTDDIITLLFQYIHMLKEDGPEEWVFKECQDLSAMTFRFKDKERPSSYTSMVAGLLQDYPLKEVLSGPYLLHEFRADLINMVLDKLTLDSVRIGIVAKQFEGMTDEKEYWYGTDYTIKPIPEETLEKWRACGCQENLKLPPRNEFIPTNFEITPREKDAPVMPELIKDDSSSRIWYKQDDTFLLPKACMNFELRSPLVYQDPVYMNMTFLMAQLVKDALNEYAYAAELSGLTYALESTIYGLFFQVKGYNDKQAVLLRKVIEKVTTFEVDPQRYDIIKELYTRSLQNFKAEQPHQHAVYYTSVLMAEQVWTNEEMLDALQDVTLEKLKAFIPQLFCKIYIEGLVYGNVTKQSALDAIELIETTMREKCCTKSLLSSQHKRYREIQLPDGCYYSYRQDNEVHRSCCLEIYYQTGMQSTHGNVLLELFCQVIAEPCFSVLRTKEQLGYIVFSGIRRSSGVQGLRVIVQSDRKPEYVETRIEAFILSMEAYMRDMSSEDFDKHVEALATKKLEKPKMLSMQNKRYWSEIISQQFNFDRDNIEVADLRTLSKDDLITFYKNSIAIDASHRHKLCVYITSSVEVNQEEAAAPQIAEDGLLPVPPMSEPCEILDVMDFKRGLALYPLAQPFIDLSKAKSKL